MTNDHFPYFWRLQFVYWGSFSVITTTSLFFWGEHITIEHLLLIFLHSLLAFGLSFPLHIIYSLIWKMATILRVIISVNCVLLGAGFWVILRGILVKLTITEEQDWFSIGAWYFGMLYALLGWAAFYHGIKYFFLMQEEHTRALSAETAVSNEQVKRLQAESKAKDAKLKMLRYQLNPHFLFNTLNAITSLVRIQANNRAQEITIKLSQFLRYTLDNNPNTKIPLKQEINILGMYLDIEKTRFQERLILEINIDKNAEEALIPSLLLQPLIENSMKYAIAKNENGGKISIKASTIGTTLQITLSDTGSPEVVRPNKIASRKGRGIGLKNTTDRLRAFYNDLYEFDLQGNHEGGLTTVITIPFEIRE
ncbi:MAG: histidine kinase [Gammaproteobacteria bacterium]|nr:histidine kinase [Gammaproteobacteria bacterium]